MELLETVMLVHAVVAQHVGAEDRRKSAIGEWQLVERSDADRPSAFDRCTRASQRVNIEPKRAFLGVTPCQPGEKPAGAAARVHEGPLYRIERQPVRQPQQVSVHPGEPPPAVLDS